MTKNITLLLYPFYMPKAHLFLYCFLCCNILITSVFSQVGDGAEDLLRTINHWKKLGNVDSAKYYTLQAQTLLPVASPISKGKIYYLLAELSFQNQAFDSVKLWLDKAIFLQETHQDKASLAGSYQLYSQYYLQGSRLEQRLNSPKAFEMSKKAFDLYREVNNQQGLANAQLNYGVLVNRMGEFYKARDLFLEAKSTFQQIKDSTGLYKANLRLGQIYGWEDRPFYSLDSSVYYCRLAIQIAELLKNKEDLAYAHNLAASSFIRKGYEDATVLKEGLISAQYAKNAYQGDSASFNFQLAYLNEGYAYEGLGLTKEATQVAKQFLEGKIKGLDTWTISEGYRLMYRIEKQLKNFEKSLYYHELYRETDDSVRNIDLRRRLSKLETAFESLAKDKEIAELAREAEVKELQIENQKRVLIGLGLLLIAISIGGYFYYQSYKSKQEKAKLELKQRFLRSQLNPHFIFNAIGAIQAYLFEHGAEKGITYLGVFSKLMRQILEFSREEFISLEDEIETLQNYLDLQKMRFKEQFTYQIHVKGDFDVSEIAIPPMFAQPVIENALEHGLFRQPNKKNQIDIFFELESEKTIRLIVTDNGVGFQEKNTYDKQQSLSTIITKERLSIIKKHMNRKVSYKAGSLQDQMGNTVGAKVEFELPIKWI